MSEEEIFVELLAMLAVHALVAIALPETLNEIQVINTPTINIPQQAALSSQETPQHPTLQKNQAAVASWGSAAIGNRACPRASLFYEFAEGNYFTRYPLLVTHYFFCNCTDYQITINLHFQNDLHWNRPEITS